MRHHLIPWMFLVFLLSCCTIRCTHGACQSCIVVMPNRMGKHNSLFPPLASSTSLMMPLVITLTRHAIMIHHHRQRQLRLVLRLDDNDQQREEENELKQLPMSALMVGAIGFYKGWISPLLPPACRFVPTCSQYGVQAIQEFGPTKGSVLIAWRLLRCSPIGGKGYDPPKWPPVSYTYSSY